MSAHHKLTTVLQRANALIWMDHINVNANLDLQEMGKHAIVGQEYTTECLLISFGLFLHINVLKILFSYLFYFIFNFFYRYR